MIHLFQSSLPPNPLKGGALCAVTTKGKVPFRGFRGQGGRIISLLFFSLLLSSHTCKAQYYKSTDSVSYDFMYPECNFIQFYDSSAFANFYNKWNNPNQSLITIAHFGDSHVQPDIFSGELRKRLQDLKGKAGFGMLFPFSTAKTYSMIDYKSTHTGEWKSSKSIQYRPVLPLGISGATCYTNDSNASFTIQFYDSIPRNYRKLRLLCKRENNSYDLLIKTAGNEIPVRISDTTNAGTDKYIDVELPGIDKSITVQLVKKNRDQNEFEFFGMSLENVKKEGLLLHCMGIGGSQYCAPLHEVLFDEQLPGISPDLAILDFGTNDYLYYNKIPPELEGQIIEVINKVRKGSPTCTILLTTTMDMYYKKKNVTSGILFANLIRKIAREQHCAFYDWYWVTGGPYKMKTWVNYKLAQPDMVHLTMRGYKLKGQLLADALLKTLSLYKNRDSLLYNTDSLKIHHPVYQAANAIVARTPVYIAKANTGQPAGKTGVIRHKILPGENLGSIARKYHVTVKEIQNLNGKNNTMIIAGRTLLIPVH